MEYLHMDREEVFLSLHDCRADRAELRDGVLSFFFPEGFWVTQDHPLNSTGKTVRTGEARVDYVLREPEGEDVSVEIFTRLRWPWDLRRAWELPKLLEAVSRKGWELEFLYQYPGGWDRIVECWLWMDRKPWHKECNLKLDVQEVRYLWNELREEHTW